MALVSDTGLEDEDRPFASLRELTGLADEFLFPAFRVVLFDMVLEAGLDAREVEEGLVEAGPPENVPTFAYNHN